MIYNIVLWYSALPSKWNPIADGLSRGGDQELIDSIPFKLKRKLNVKSTAAKLSKAIGSFITNIKAGTGSAEFVKRFRLI